MTSPSNTETKALRRREMIGRLCRLGLQGMAATALWQFWSDRQTLAAPDPLRSIPPMDRAAPDHLETATFGLG